MSETIDKPTSRISDQHAKLNERLKFVLGDDVSWNVVGRASANGYVVKPRSITVFTRGDEAPTTRQIRRVAGIFQRYYDDVYISPEGRELPDVAIPVEVRVNGKEAWSFDLPLERYLYRQAIEVLSTSRRQAHDLSVILSQQEEPEQAYDATVVLGAPGVPVVVTEDDDAWDTVKRRARQKVDEMLVTPPPEREY